MLKQVIVINSKLEMSAGKMAAQASHASLGAFLRADSRKIADWQEQGQKKVVVKADDLIKLKQVADDLEIANFLVKDAGLTELEAGTMTALGLGPDQEEKIDKITGGLKLL